MIEINNDVVFVQGVVAGAIYDLRNGNIFSVNSNSCGAINHYIRNTALTPEESEYISLLENKGLIDYTFMPIQYTPIMQEAELDLCWLEITQGCNCRCIHCYEGESHIPSTKSLSLDEWRDIVDQISLCGVKRVVIIGGEPCIHPNINEIAEYVSSKSINTTIFTNGTYISNDLKKTIIKNGIKMKFSLYGHCSEVHDKITRCPGSFRKLIDSIEYFIKSNIQVNVAVVIMRENESYYYEIIDFLKGLGVTNYRVDVIRETFCNIQSSHLPESNAIIELVKRTRPSFQKITKAKFDRACSRNTCWSGKIVVCEDGSVLPCVFARNIVLGNVKDDTIKDILTAKITNDCWHFDFSKVRECGECEFRFACKDCRPLAEASLGLFEKNPRCNYNVYTGEWK